MTRRQICIKANLAWQVQMYQTFEERFWARVNKKGPIPAHCPQLGRCWIWRDTNKRYGEVKFRGKKHLAHRFMFELINGPIPKGLNVCHHCDTPKCVNPNHLFTGTHRDNILDSVKKGRWGASKLNPSDIPTIRKLRGTMTNKTLAAKFGISVPTVEGVLYGHHWSHIP